MVQSELVSIIVPVFNVQDYLVECVDSLLHQTYTDLEILLIDDGSTDNSGKLCDEINKEDSRIKVYHKKNGGLSDARNYGIDKANGNYLIFVDSDDFVDAGLVETLMKYSCKRDALVLCEFEYVDENGSKYQEHNMLKKMTWNRQEFWMNFYNNYNAVCVVAWNKLYKKEWFDNVRFEKGKYHEDEYIIDLIVNQVNQIYCLDYVGYYYRQRIGSIMNSVYDVRRLDGVEAQINRGKRAIQNNDMWLAEKSIVNAINNLIQGYYKLDGSVENNVMRLQNLDNKLKCVCVELLNLNISMKTRINIYLFLINKGLYNKTHNFLNIILRKREN